MPIGAAIFLGFAWAIVATWAVWVFADSAVRDKKPLTLTRVLMALLWPATVAAFVVYAVVVGPFWLCWKWGEYNAKVQK